MKSIVSLYNVHRDGSLEKVNRVPCTLESFKKFATLRPQGLIKIYEALYKQGWFLELFSALSDDNIIGRLHVLDSIDLNTIKIQTKTPHKFKLVDWIKNKFKSPYAL